VPSTANAPPTTTSSSGNSFAAVATEFSREPSVTPRRLTSDQKVNTTARIRASIARPASAGTSRPMPDANTVATAAVANTPVIHSRTPERNPA
jgi:hypothetical protein